MFEYKLIVNDGIPSHTPVTAYALMPKVLVCIKGERATVFRNRVIVRKFRHWENAIRNYKKLVIKEKATASRIYMTVSKGSLMYISQRKQLKKREDQIHIGFENAI